ncbi:MAG: cell envelope integrity protein CreD [Parvularculaceae bacterium]|nr:cell envelope integrity protein CreD [Parvularculaceae bacterium]
MMTPRLSAPARSLGLKLILVGALAFLLWLPAMMIYALVWERSNRADAVQNEIYAQSGGRQLIAGPFLIAPAQIDTGRTDAAGEPVIRRTSVVFTPQSLDIAGDIATERRQRSIYDATVYETTLTLSGRFSALTPPASADGALTVFWDQAALAVKLGANENLKGLRDRPLLTIDGAAAGNIDFEPGLGAGMARGDGDWLARLAGLSAPFALAEKEDGFSFSLVLPLSGGGALNFAPVGENTRVELTSRWPHPGFQGAYSPDSRAIGADGFSAQWRIPYLARNLPRAFFTDGDLSIIDQDKSFGVEFVSTDSPYQSVNRALKYALMFLGLVFLTFFLIEATMGGRAHPAQYILLGLTQVIFYLLVLAFAEHIGFESAFVGTAGATVLLSGWYAATVFRSVLRGLIALFAFAGAYGLIYLLMKSEDYALLIGSVTAFGAIALTMAVTRNIDWYGARAEQQAGP